MTSQWCLRPHDRDRVASLSREAAVPPLIAHLLLNRGITNAATAKLFLSARRDGLHDPETLPGVVEAADRIVRAIRDGRKIVVYGDYDVDGVCGTSLLWECLRLAGARDAEYYIPHRVDEGYGVNAEALRKLATDHHASMIITVDCGVSAVKEALLARELGIELIVTDHHTPGPEWPSAVAVVHPLASGGSNPFLDLCGAGVAFKLAWQICKSFGDGKKASPHLRDYLLKAINLVALATVADLVPLEGENRIFVRHGLRGISADSSVGLKALLQVSGLLAKDKLNTGNLGFSLGPRINAAGRLHYAMKAVQLLTTTDASEAMDLAQLLDDCNRQRQEVERSIAAQAHQMIDESGGLGDRGAIVLGHSSWHPGVIGIVASRIVDTYHRPTIIVALGEKIGQGSARSVEGFHLYDALHACSEGLTSFGGHKMAAGLKILPELFPAFAERFDHHCRGALAAEHRQKRIMIDAEVPLASLTVKVVEGINDLEPYGISNPRPMLLAENVTITGDARVVGEKKDTVQLKFSQGNTTLKAVAFKMVQRASQLKSGMKCAVVFEPNINEWNGRRDVQMTVKDFRVHGDGEPGDGGD